MHRADTQDQPRVPRICNKTFSIVLAGQLPLPLGQNHNNNIHGHHKND
jgi:hypothetical protein